MNVSKSTLRTLSALVWYAGGIVLLYKGGSYLLAAAAARPESWLPWLGGVVGAGTGAVRGRRAFAQSCRRNLARIDALRDPKAWQFFRPVFFLALAAMGAAGAVLRMIAEAGGFWAALLVGSLELVIALALLTSSREFWRWGGDSAAARPIREAAAGSRRSPAEAAGDVV